MAKRTVGLIVMGIVMVLYGLLFLWGEGDTLLWQYKKGNISSYLSRNPLSLPWIMLGLTYLFSGILCLFGLSRSYHFRTFLLILSVLTIPCLLIGFYTQGDIPFSAALLLNSPLLIIPGYIILYITRYAKKG